MAFNDELLKDGRGRAIRIDGSLDGFSTITYRWGDVAGELDGTNMYSSRVLSLAPVPRELGQNRIAAGGATELVLANADGALDALAGHESLSTQAKLRLRVYVVLWTPGASPLSLTSKMLGEFSLSKWARRNNETIIMPLGDDVMGAVSQQAALPTFADWQAVGNTSTNPLINGCGLPDSETEHTPIQLAFGEDWVLAHPHVLPFGTLDAAYQKKMIVPVCCTSSTGAADQGEITNLRIYWLDGNSKTARLIDVPRTVWDNVNNTEVTVWTVERSPTITKDGKSFKILYLVVRDDLGALSRSYNYINGGHAVVNVQLTNSYDSSDYSNEYLGGYPPTAISQRRAEHSNSAAQAQYGCFGAGVLAWYVKGVPLSARTQTTDSIQHPVDVLTDLVTHYSNNTAISINSTEAARVKAATTTAACAGVVQPWTQGPKRGDTSFQQPPSLRQVITEICQSSDIDCFIDWSGQFSFATDFWDLTFASSGSASWTPDASGQTSGNGVTTAYVPAVIPETWIRDLEEIIPSNGERWAPFNRLWLSGAKANPAEGLEPGFQGPWDFPEAAVSLSSRIIEATLDQGWRPFRQQTQTPWHWRQLNITARTVVTFRTHIGALQLELGQYFALTWTRGPQLGGPYSGTIFQVEAITYAAGDDSVEITAVWRDDVMNERQYILDDETLIVRDKAGGAGSLSCNDGNTDATAGGTIDFDDMGIEVGDILVLRCTTDDDDDFNGNACHRITEVTSATEIQVDPPFGTLNTNPIPDDEWHIERGATTYHTASSDPTNYPLGGERYGKVTDSDFEYSNDEVGNRLISG